jgi:hypothetical protein
MGHSVSKLLGRINSMVSQKLIEEQPQIPFGYAQGRLSTHHPQAEEYAWGPVRSG